MRNKFLILTALVAFPFFGAAEVRAEEYCREYTKNVYIGGRTEQAYGTACYRPDGSWEIVDLEGSDYGRNQVRDVMYQDLQNDYRRTPYREVVVRERYSKPYYSHYKKANYYEPIVFNFGYRDRDHDRDKYYKKQKYNKAKYNRHDRHHDRGRRGHD
jgi:hypothetical protein